MYFYIMDVVRLMQIPEVTWRLWFHLLEVVKPTNLRILEVHKALRGHGGAKTGEPNFLADWRSIIYMI